jgi:hypothetical protein
MDVIDIKEFGDNLLLTQIFCESKNPQENIASALRSFNPEYNEQPLFSYKNSGRGYWMTVWAKDPLSQENKHLYDELFEKQLAYKTSIVKLEIQDIEFKGRILLAEIDCTVVDGASEAESRGLIDINDCPPIDAWFYKLTQGDRRILFAWIPLQFVHLVDEGIAVNALDCFRWYNGEDDLPNYDMHDTQINQYPKEKRFTLFYLLKKLFR